MKIRDLLAAESIELNGKVTGKKEALDAMVDLMAKSGKINDVEVYRKGVYAREEESTTGIGEGIAIPHCKSDSVSRPGLAAMVVPEGVICLSSHDFTRKRGNPEHKSGGVALNYKRHFPGLASVMFLPS